MTSQRSCTYCDTPSAGRERFCTQCGAPLPSLPVEASPEATEAPGKGWSWWVEPGEAAFRVLIPQGWLALGIVDRRTPYGLPCCLFEATSDAQRGRGVRVGCIPWQFSDTAPAAGAAGGGWLGEVVGGLLGALANPAAALAGLMGQESLPYLDARSFAQQWLLPRLAQEGRPGLQLVGCSSSAEGTEALRRKAEADAARQGLTGQVTCSVADVTVRFGPPACLMQEVMRVATTRLSAPSSMLGASPHVWFAEIAWSYYAPAQELGGWASTLERIAASFEDNIAWQARVQAEVQATLSAQRLDNQARLRQISQTLSETSHIISAGYESRQQIQAQHEHARSSAAPESWSQRWSNAMLGVEDRYDDRGNHVRVEGGHERVWRDNQGNLHTGGYGSVPDPTWHELRKPPGG